MGVLEASTEGQDENDAEMFMTPPETLSRCGYTTSVHLTLTNQTNKHITNYNVASRGALTADC